MFAFYVYWALAHITLSNTATLQTCSVNSTRTAIGCYKTQLTSTSPITALIYFNDYLNVSSNTTQQKYCGSKCFSLGTTYYVLYNQTGCACVNVSSTLSLSFGSCLSDANCPGTTYCGSGTPELGAWWFCSPYSKCDLSTVPNGMAFPNGFTQTCIYYQWDEYLENDYLRRSCLNGYCLQDSSFLQCKSSAWVVLGETSDPVCLPCSDGPTDCSSTGSSCKPVLPPTGTCIKLNMTTTTLTSSIPTSTSISTVTTISTGSPDPEDSLLTNVPWYGGDKDPLPSNKIYVLVNVTNYPKNDRPMNITDHRGATNVSMAVTVQGMHVVSELTSSLTLDLYFYISWLDSRLSWNKLPIVGPSTSFFQLTTEQDQRQLWIPPIYIGNSLSAEKPNSHKESSVTFLNSDGHVTNTFRTIATVTCKMDLRNFPFDSQTCSIYFGIFGYYDKQVQLNWAVPVLFNLSNPTIPFTFNSNISLSTWTIKNFYLSTSGAFAIDDAVCTKYRTCLVAKVELKRKVSFYVVDTFLPTLIILAGSSLSFWINPENVPARVSMGLTLFLTLQATNLNVRNKLPSVSYIKAIDIWLFFAQGCVFVTLLEFLLLHVIINGYVDLRRFRISTKHNKSVQTSEDSGFSKETSKNPRSNAAMKVEKIARIVYPTIICLFILTYFSIYLAE